MKKAVIFDLDGVIVSTDEYHYRAWKAIADEQGIPFDRTVNERLRGVSRMNSLEIILEKASRTYTAEEKTALCDRKNALYKQLILQLTPEDILDGVMPLLAFLKENGIKTAIGSSSRNTGVILRQIGLQDTFDAVCDGNCITRSKPDPEVFLKAAEMLGAAPEDCIVFEDAFSGIAAAKAAGMTGFGVGFAAACEQADYRCKTMADETIKKEMSALCGI